MKTVEINDLADAIIEEHFRFWPDFQTGDFSSIAEVRAANEDAGKHWFGADEMRFFGTRIPGDIFGGCVFPLSNKNFDGTARDYLVAIVSEDGDIRTSKRLPVDSMAEVRRIAEQVAEKLEGRG